MRQSNESANECVLRLLKTLTKHFNVELSEDQVEIFVHALRNNTTYQIEKSFDRCMNECEFMPKLADVHKRMPEEKWPMRDVGFVAQRPMLDVVREIVYELEPNYDSITDPKRIAELFFRANRLRYERMGIDARKWGDFEQLGVKQLSK